MTRNTKLMTCFITGILLFATFAAYSGSARDDSKDATLNEHLQPLQPFIGKTWKGKAPDAENPVYDVSRWERALNGQAVRILHSLNDGEYGGETIIYWDSDKESLIFYYFTTAGFYTHGTFELKDGKFISHEKVTGNADGITEVRSTGELLPDGRMRTTSEYLKNGEWVPGHEFIYEEDPSAEVVFK